MKIHHYVLVMLLVLPSLVHAQSNTTKGREFWLSYMENLSLNMNGSPEFSLVISSEYTTSGSIEFPATGFTIPFSVNAMQPTEVYLPASILYPQGDEDISNTGIKITSLDSINVYAYHHRLYFSEATMVVPVNELSSTCMITAAKDVQNANPSQLVVLATEDSTLISITPSVLTLSVRPPGVPFYVTLQKGQSYQIQAFGDLSGTIITSVDPSKKIATFAGARQAYLGCGNSADSHVYDASYPTMFGNSFVVVPFLNFGGDPVKVLSSADSNLVFINNGTPLMLNKGEYVDTVISAATFIAAEKEVAVSQFIKSSNCNSNMSGDPNMVVLTPSNLMKTTAIFKSVQGPQNATFVHNPYHYVNIVTKNSPANANVTLDGVPVSGFLPVSVNPQYSYAQVSVSQGDHVLFSPDGFNAVSYDYGDYNATTFHLGYDYDEILSGIPLHENEIKSSVYPNPFMEKSTLTVYTPTPLIKAEVVIYSADGKLVFQKLFSGNSTMIESNTLSSGFYYYCILSERSVLSKGKFSVQ